MANIAVSHPGRMGDALYALPVARAIAHANGEPVDFFTSKYCEPLTGLLEYQSCIDKVIIPEEYVIERMDMGIQPWRMPVPDSYRRIYHLGFRSVPDRPLHEFIGAQTGIEPTPIWYHHPRDISHLPHYWPYASLTLPKIDVMPDFVALGSRGPTTYKDLFLEFIELCPLPVAQIGGEGEFIGDRSDNNIDFTGFDFLDTVTLLSRASAFVGLMSSQLVLANGFDIPKVAPHDGRSWDMRHVVTGLNNIYLVNPTAQTMVDAATEIYSKTFSPDDYSWLNNKYHVLETERLLRGTPARFEHKHRLWEYSMALTAIQRHSTTDACILDVGGGGSVFAPALARLGYVVQQLDPGHVEGWIAEQEKRLKVSLPFTKMDFNLYTVPKHDFGKWQVVTCLSVLEHIPNDMYFFDRLCKTVAPGGLLIVTVDYHESGMPQCNGHIRTYNRKGMEDLIVRAMDHGLFSLKGQVRYDNFGRFVNGYNFASLILTKQPSDEG